MTQQRFPTPVRPLLHRRSAARGFSLIELMVALVIGMGLIVTMGLLNSKFETAKRERGASADLSSTAAFLSYDLDRQIRSAGSGFSTSWGNSYGCVLTASRKNVQILPAPAAFPAPFASVPQTVRMVPMVAYAGTATTTPDVLQIMTGTGGIGEVPNAVRSKSISTDLFRLTSTLGLQADDLLLLTETGMPCMVEQISSVVDDQVNLGGDYYASVINSQALNDRSIGGSTTQAFLLGNATNGNPPRMFLLGINSSQQLVRYDLMGFTNAASSSLAPVPLADGVMDMRVLYGVDTTGDGIIDSWVGPRTTGYDAATISSTQATARQIIAVKVSLVLRSQQIEDVVPTSAPSDAQGSTSTSRSTFNVAPASLVMFPSMATNLQTTYTVADRQRRHVVVEFTVPLRNLISTIRSGTPN